VQTLYNLCDSFTPIFDF